MLNGLSGLVPDNLSDELGSPKPVKVSLRKDSSVGALPKSAQSGDRVGQKPTKLELLMNSTKTTDRNSKAGSLGLSATK